MKHRWKKGKRISNRGGEIIEHEEIGWERKKRWKW